MFAKPLCCVNLWGRVFKKPGLVRLKFFNMTHVSHDLFNNPGGFFILLWNLKMTKIHQIGETLSSGYIVHLKKVSFRQNPWRSLVDWWLGPPQGESSVGVGKKGPWFFPTGKGHAMKVCKQQIDAHWFFLICFYILLLSLYIDYCLMYFCIMFVHVFFCDFFVTMWFHIHVFICCFCVSSDLFVQLFVKRTNNWGCRIWFGGGTSCSSIETAMCVNWILKDHRQLSAQTTAKTNTPC